MVDQGSLQNSDTPGDSAGDRAAGDAAVPGSPSLAGLDHGAEQPEPRSHSGATGASTGRTAPVVHAAVIRSTAASSSRSGWNWERLNLATPHTTPDEFNSALGAERITIWIRWVGLAVGAVVVNLTGEQPNRAMLDSILLLGGVYAILDTYFSLQHKVFLNDAPLFVSLMEAVFIGLLCFFEDGLLSPFRFYYFLSVLVCAIRYPAWMTYFTCGLHAVSYMSLTITRPPLKDTELSAMIFMLVLLAWMTWAMASLSELLKAASRRLAVLNEQLRQNQVLLEARIAQRTSELQQSQAMLVQHEKQAAFGLLAAGIAHEVGNPLAAISSLVQMLNRRDIDPTTREKLQLVDDQLRRIQRTLRELVDFSRPASKEVHLVDIHSVIDNALNIAKYYKRKKGKLIVTRYARGLPAMRLVRDQMVQVFLNLILNALDATEEGGQLEIGTSLQSGWVRIDVRDDGPGIPEALRARIFQPYLTTKSTGTGLGLFVCRNILEQTGGRIELSDSSPRGTTFSVYLTCEIVKTHPDIECPPAAAMARIEEVSLS